jgi:hypothetical protein
MIKLVNLLKETRKEQIEEFNAKKALATGALALGLTASPNLAKSQDKVPTPIVQQDTSGTVKVTYTHPNEGTARMMANQKARDFLKGKTGDIVKTQVFELKDGRYECEITIKLEK